MRSAPSTSVIEVFKSCVQAIRAGELIRRESRSDKEFHFQNWIGARLDSTGFNHEMGGRNSYPDYRMVRFTDGYEVKGLAYPGREVNYDCNSQVPSGQHNSRTIFYVFGRYPAKPDGDSYPVLDLVICHGDFLNADHEYVHKNRNIKGFGSYGDIMIRDRKMYVAPTPFGLVSGAAHYQTLVLPDGFPVPEDFLKVGSLVRKGTDALIVAYKFELKHNTLTPETVPNPNTGRKHAFTAWRAPNCSQDPVQMDERSSTRIAIEDDEDDGE